MLVTLLYIAYIQIYRINQSKTIGINKNLKTKAGF